MSLPDDLQRLPPQALDLIRYLGAQDDPVSVDEIMAATGLSERSFGKGIRRLVTRYYAEMPFDGFYSLTANGRQAAASLREADGDDAPVFAAPQEPPPAPAVLEAEPEAAPPAPDGHRRQLAVLVPGELVVGAEAVLRAGFGRPVDGTVPLAVPGRVVLRVRVPGCELRPAERPLEVPPAGPSPPVEFLLVPQGEGEVRIKIVVYQLVDSGAMQLIGGIYFRLNVAGFPTPASAEMQTLAGEVVLAG